MDDRMEGGINDGMEGHGRWVDGRWMVPRKTVTEGGRDGNENWAG